MSNPSTNFLKIKQISPSTSSFNSTLNFCRASISGQNNLFCVTNKTQNLTNENNLLKPPSRSSPEDVDTNPRFSAKVRNPLSISDPSNNMPNPATLTQDQVGINPLTDKNFDWNKALWVRPFSPKRKTSAKLIARTVPFLLDESQEIPPSAVLEISTNKVFPLAAKSPPNANLQNVKATYCLAAYEVLKRKNGDSALDAEKLKEWRLDNEFFEYDEENSLFTLELSKLCEVLDSASTSKGKTSPTTSKRSKSSSNRGISEEGASTDPKQKRREIEEGKYWFGTFSNEAEWRRFRCDQKILKNLAGPLIVKKEPGHIQVIIIFENCIDCVPMRAKFFNANESNLTRQENLHHITNTKEFKEAKKTMSSKKKIKEEEESQKVSQRRHLENILLADPDKNKKRKLGNFESAGTKMPKLDSTDVANDKEVQTPIFHAEEKQSEVPIDGRLARIIKLFRTLYPH